MKRIADFRELLACRLHQQRQQLRPLKLPRRTADLLRVGGLSTDVQRAAVLATGNRGDCFARVQRFESAIAHARMAISIFFVRRIGIAQRCKNRWISVFNRGMDIFLECRADLAEVVVGSDERGAVREEWLAEEGGRTGDQFQRHRARVAAVVVHRSSGNGVFGLDFLRFGEAAFESQRQVISRSLRIFQRFWHNVALVVRS